MSLRRVLVAAWLGFALAALFFYPLAAVLNSDVYYLQWQPRDTLEAVTALILLGIAIAFGMFKLWHRSERWAVVALVAVAALPLASFAAGVSRQVGYSDELRTAWESPAIRFGVPLVITGVIGWLLVWSPRAFSRWFRRLLVGLSPVALVVVGSVITAASQEAVVLTVDREHTTTTGKASAECAPVLALLFDELSFSYLYDGREIRPEFREIRRVGETATHYLAVAAPARETLVALPSFLAARHLRGVRVMGTTLFEVDEAGDLQPFSATAASGLFGTANQLGFNTEIAGYYLPYCDLLGGFVERCRSLSFYRVATPGFSPVDPILTTLVLWPRQFPFGLLKNPPFAVLQRTLVEHTIKFARQPLRSESGRPVFRFAHFSVPHMPFVFDENGYDPPDDPLHTASDVHYVEQLRFVDQLVGEITDALRRQGRYDEVTIALFADHGFRFGGRERDPLQIPFIVKMAGQTVRTDVTDSIAGETLLKDVVEGSCSVFN